MGSENFGYFAGPKLIQSRSARGLWKRPVDGLSSTSILLCRRSVCQGGWPLGALQPII